MALQPYEPPPTEPVRYEPGAWRQAHGTTWGEASPDRVVHFAPTSRRRHRYGGGMVDIERQDHAQPLRTFSEPGQREQAANALLRMRVWLARLGTVVAVVVLLAALLGAIALVILGVHVVQWADGVDL